MDVIVCIKRVPETTEANIQIDEEASKIKEEGLAFTINEADNYALEEALLIKEKHGGTVTLISVGPEPVQDILRMGLAKGADEAIRCDDEAFDGSDGLAIARILKKAVQGRPFDLILTGCMATDSWDSIIGPALAEHLEIPHAAMVTHVDITERRIEVSRELEGGVLEVLDIQLPALLTIQTGINEPRYASVLGIAKASRRELEVYDATQLEIKTEDVGQTGSDTNIEKLTLPVQEKMAEIIPGPVEDAVNRLSEILKERGLV
jgi:electron transfer flavoprotein beta subunit